MGRTALSAAMGGATAARPLGGISGVRPGTPTTIATATSTTWTVTPFGGYIDAQTLATNGGYFFSFQNTSTGTVTAAAGSARVDLLYVQTADTGVDATTVAPRAILDYQVGVGGAGIPALTAPRAFVIAQINVPASGGGSPTVTWVAPYTIAAGGILPVANAAGLPASPYVGQQVDNAALGGPSRWNGAAWRGLAGLVPVIPVNATGGTVSPGGSVTFSGATSVSLNVCFTTEFDNYQIVFDFTTSAGAGVNFTLRLGGTDAITGYDSQRFIVNNTTTTALQSLNTASWVGSGGLGDIGARHIGTLLLFKPALAVATGAQITNTITTNPMTTTAGIYTGLLQHRTATAYDGITFTPGAGTFTGTARVYGYNNEV